MSRFEEGDSGTGVYAAVGNYAYNAKKVFIGDPMGLSEAAVVRRTSAMLSLAIRFGSTDFMDAAPKQVKGDTEKGIAPLNWRGNDVEKTRALIDTFLTTLNNQFPQLLSGYHYDFNKRGFYDRLGRPLDAARLERGEGTSASRGARTGSRTTRRGIFLQSLVSSESSQRPNILADILRRGHSLVRNGQLTALLSQKPANQAIGDRTITQVRDKLISRFGKRIIDLLESKGILKIHQSMSDKDIPAEAVKQSEGVTEGFYLNGTVHLIADNLTDETIIPTFVHELGGHKGFQEMMSPKAYELIMQQFDRLVAQGNAIAIKAKQRAEKAEKDTARQQDEYIPYLLTEQEKAQFATPQERNAVKRLIDHILRAVKGWVVRTLSKYSATAGISKRVSETLDARDIQLMAERMIKDIAKRGGDNKPTNTDIRFNQKNNEQSLAPLNPVNTRNILDRLLRGFAPKTDAMRNSPVLRVRVVKSFIDLPLAIQEEANKQGSNGSDIKGVFHNNTFYAVADNLYSAHEVEQTFFHEVYGHYGVRQLFGDALNAELNNLWQAIGGIDGMRNLAKQHEIDLALYEKGLGQTNYSQETKNLILMDELLAHIAEIRTPSIKQVFNELMGKIRAWLRENGFVKLANFNNQDLAHILVKAKKAAHESVILKNNEQAIRFSRAEDKAKAAKDYVLDSVRISNKAKANLHAKSELGWWHKTLGTQQNTAIQHKDFGRVYKTLLKKPQDMHKQ